MKKIIYISLFLIIPSVAFSQFLTKGGVRNAALGGTGISSSNDISSSIWNPSLLGYFNRIELLTDQRKFFWNLMNDNLAFNFISVGFPLGNFGTIAASTTFFNATNYNENKIGLHYGKSLFKRKVSFGFSLYSFSKNYEHNEYTLNDPFFEEFGNSRNAVDFDFGLSIRPARNFKIGLIAQNLLQTDLAISLYDKDQLPLTFGTGISYKWNKLTLAIDLMLETFENKERNEFLYGIGIEYKLMKKLLLRFGNDNYRIASGFGLNIFSKRWTEKFYDPFSSNEFLNIKGFDIVLDYCVQLPIKGLYSSYGDHFLGVRINFFNSTTDMSLLKNKVPPRIEEKSKLVTQIKEDTVYVVKVRVDTLVKNSVMRDTVKIYDKKTYEMLMANAKELKEAKRELKGMSNWNTAMMHLLNSLKFYYSEQYDKAISECKNAIKYAPGMALAYVRLGSIYFRIGQVDLAKQYWKTAKRIDPNNEELKQIPTQYLN